MSIIESIRVQPRATSGGGASRSLRRQGMIPGIMYGGGEPNILLEIDPRDIEKGLDHPGFYTTIFELKINGKTEKALAKSIQFHPVTDRPLHVDFYRVRKDSKLHVNIPVVFINEEKSPGLKRGGVLNIVLHSLEVTCLADKIPENITIDLTGLDIGDSIHTDTIGLPEGVQATHPDRDNTLATIAAPTTAKEETEETEESAADASKEADEKTNGTGKGK